MFEQPCGSASTTYLPAQDGSSNANLSTIADTLFREVEGDAQANANRYHGEVSAVLRTMPVACEAIVEVIRDLCKANALVAGHGGSEGTEIISDGVGIIAVDD